MDKIFYINRSWWESSVTVSSAVVNIAQEMEESDPLVFVACCLLAVSVLTHNFTVFIIKEKNVLELVIFFPRVTLKCSALRAEELKLTRVYSQIGKEYKKMRDWVYLNKIINHFSVFLMVLSLQHLQHVLHFLYCWSEQDFSKNLSSIQTAECWCLRHVHKSPLQPLHV